jgi:putative molybdopterin biosynthesis protein
MEHHGTQPIEKPAEVLTVDEVAKVLRVNPKTVYGLAKKGLLPSFRVGRVMRWRRSEVNRFMSQPISSTAETARENAR